MCKIVISDSRKYHFDSKTFFFLYMKKGHINERDSWTALIKNEGSILVCFFLEIFLEIQWKWKNVLYTFTGNAVQYPVGDFKLQDFSKFCSEICLQFPFTSLHSIKWCFMSAVTHLCPAISSTLKF